MMTTKDQKIKEANLLPPNRVWDAIFASMLKHVEENKKNLKK